VPAASRFPFPDPLVTAPLRFFLPTPFTGETAGMLPPPARSFFEDFLVERSGVGGLSLRARDGRSLPGDFTGECDVCFSSPPFRAPPRSLRARPMSASTGPGTSPSR